MLDHTLLFQTVHATVYLLSSPLSITAVAADLNTGTILKGKSLKTEANKVVRLAKIDVRKVEGKSGWKF